MILTDTGPLVALADKNEPAHLRCVAATKTLPKSPLLTTWPCFTEAMYLLGKEGGYRAQQELWQLRRRGFVVLHPLMEAEGNRMDALMQQYKDIPMDLADASLVVVAETLNLSLVFTLDSHFSAYRLKNAGAFQVVPSF